MNRSIRLNMSPLTTRAAVRYALMCAWLLLAASGCSGALQQASSGQIGCSPDQIDVTDDSVGFGARSWTATCGGKRYFCSAAGHTVSCKPAVN